jgi:hypothetical protein
MLYLETAGIAIGILSILGLYRFIRHHGLPVLLWRWYSGHSLDGISRTNATWFQAADTVTHSSGRVHPWHYLPRFKRAIIRTVSTFAPAGIAYGIIKAPYVLLAVGCVSVIAGLGYAVWRLRIWHTDRVLKIPLSAALAGILELTPSQTVKSVALPTRFGPNMSGEIGAITLPSRFRASPEQRRATEHLVRSRLPVDVDFSWKTSQNPQTLGILAAPKPPDMVKFKEYVALMEACKSGEVFLGLDRYKEPYYGSFNSDDPHWGFSVGSGRGKSTFLQGTAAQVLHNDPNATLDGIDPKMSSLTPLVGIPGVTIACDPQNIPEMWDVIIRFKARMLERLEIQKTDPTAEFPIRLLAIDELNMFSNMSAAYWKSLPKSERPTSTPSVWQDIASILWMGRAARCHAIFVGQRLDDKATGGIGLRDSLGFRGLAGYRGNQWAMLVGTTPVPRSQKPKGRWIYSDGMQETWVQNVYGSPQMIRDYATAKRLKTPVQSSSRV